MASSENLFSKLYIFAILFICQLKIIKAVPVEPVCSKFSYDEQLLEKMVRMEFFVENMQKDVEKSVSDVMYLMIDIKGNNSELSDRFSEQQEKIDSLERQTDVLNDTMANKSIVSENTKIMKSMAVFVENIKKDLKESTSGFDDLKSVTDRINSKCEDGLSGMSEKIAGLEKQIGELKPGTINKQTIAFNVMDAVSFSGKEAVKFSDIILNEGNAYDKDTGIFTAPTAGIYQFNAHICGKEEKEIEYFIKVDSKKVLMGEFKLAENAGDTKCTSFSAFAMVQKGGKVSVGGMSFSDLDRVADSDLSSFSGALIHSTVAFNVAEAVNYTGSDAIKFSNIILNEGNAYNKDTGIFTAPIDGIYQFNAHVCGNKTIDEIDYYINVNSQWIVSGEFTVPARAADAKCTSFSAVALVRKGETVRVGGMFFSKIEENNNDVCSFSGVLIQSI